MERFSSSDEDIKFYTGFPDYVTLLEFWKYVEPNASKLTYFSFVRDNTDSINFEDKFPFMAGKEKSFPGRKVGCARSLQPIALRTNDVTKIETPCVTQTNKLFHVPFLVKR